MEENVKKNLIAITDSNQSIKNIKNFNENKGKIYKSNIIQYSRCNSEIRNRRIENEKRNK